MALSSRLALVYVATFLWMGVYIPYWPVWLSERGMTAGQIGLLLAAGPWTRVLASPLAGRWADRSGKPGRLVQALSLALVVALASFSLAHDFPALLGIMVLTGLAFAPIIPLTDGLTVGAEAEGLVRYGPVRLWGSAAFIAIAWGGGELIERLGAPLILWLLVGAAGLLAAMSMLLPVGPAAYRGGSGRAGPDPDGSPAEDAGPELTTAEAAGPRVSVPEARDPCAAASSALLTRPLRAPRFVGFLLIAALLHAGHAVLYAFATKHWQAEGLDEGTAGMLWSSAVLAEIGLFAAAPWIGRRLSPHGLWAVAGLAGVLRWSVLASTLVVPWLLLAQALHALTFGALHIGAMNYIRRSVDASARSLATNLYAAISAGLGLGIALPIAGLLYEAWRGGAYWGMAACSLLGMALALALRPAPPR